MDELVEELFYLAFLRLLAHHTDSRLVGGEYLGRVRPVFSQASVMPGVRTSSNRSGQKHKLATAQIPDTGMKPWRCQEEGRT